MVGKCAQKRGREAGECRHSAMLHMAGLSWAGQSAQAAHATRRADRHAEQRGCGIAQLRHTSCLFERAAAQQAHATLAQSQAHASQSQLHKSEMCVRVPAACFPRGARIWAGRAGPSVHLAHGEAGDAEEGADLAHHGHHVVQVEHQGDCGERRTGRMQNSWNRQPGKGGDTT